jgi:glycosyltransferase involved in cell wall biosynthesis
LQVTNRIPWPLNDGGNIATYNVSRFLHRRGHRVVLASLNTKKHYQDPSVLKEIDEIHTVDIDTTLNIPGLLKGLVSAQPYNVERFRSKEFADLLARLVTENQFDIIQIEGSYLSLYIDVIRQHTDCPVVLRSHNVEFKIWERLAANTSNPLKRFYLKDLARKIKKFETKWIDACDGIIPIAGQDTEFYRKAGFTGHLQTINGGVDLEAFRPTVPPFFSPTISFLGSLEWQPNVQGLHWFLDQVWPKVIAKHPEAEFHVAGKNPPAELEKLSAPGLHFHGMVPDAHTFLDAYHIFVVPLFSGGGMRMKIVEAMANGKCTVSTRIGAEGIAYTDGRNILLAEEPEEWALILNDLLTSQLRSVEIAENGMELAQDKYSWEAIVEQFEAFYREVQA